MERVAVFIDWQNCYHCAREAFHRETDSSPCGQVRPRALSELLAEKGPAGRSVVHIGMYRGQPDPRVDPRTQWRAHAPAGRLGGGVRAAPDHADEGATLPRRSATRRSRREGRRCSARDRRHAPRRLWRLRYGHPRHHRYRFPASGRGHPRTSARARFTLGRSGWMGRAVPGSECPGRAGEVDWTARLHGDTGHDGLQRSGLSAPSLGVRPGPPRNDDEERPVRSRGPGG